MVTILFLSLVLFSDHNNAISKLLIPKYGIITRDLGLNECVILYNIADISPILILLILMPLILLFSFFEVAFVRSKK